MKLFNLNGNDEPLLLSSMMIYTFIGTLFSYSSIHVLGGYEEPPPPHLHPLDIWPIWNLIPIRFFKSHRIFKPSYNIFYEEVNINHTSLCLSQASYISIKAFDYMGSSKVIFIKISEFDQISLKILPYHTEFSPHLMACIPIHSS